ncbi:hypothetical protein KY284_020423 [Solanum tuberosum]|nr:hypothetical protein KY284_020423 [Solanum tuberosum]
MRPTYESWIGQRAILVNRHKVLKLDNFKENWIGQSRLYLWSVCHFTNCRWRPSVCYPTTDKTPRLRARPNRAAQAASDKEADSQTEEAVATIAEVQHQKQPQAGGPAQEAVVEPVETGTKPGRVNQGTQTVEQQPVIHSVNHKFFLLTKRE